MRALSAVGFVTYILAQAQHVLGVAVTAAVARNRLDREKGEPSLPAQPLHDVDGGDLDEAI